MDILDFWIIGAVIIVFVIIVFFIFRDTKHSKYFDSTKDENGEKH